MQEEKNRICKKSNQMDLSILKKKKKLLIIFLYFLKIQLDQTIKYSFQILCII